MYESNSHLNGNAAIKWFSNVYLRILLRQAENENNIIMIEMFSFNLFSTRNTVQKHDQCLQYYRH